MHFLKIDPMVAVLACIAVLAHPIDFAGRPYNTLTLPCERVIELVSKTICSGHVVKLDTVIK